MFSKIRRSKSEAAAHQPKKQLTGMPALKFMRKSKKKTSYSDLSNPIVPLPEHERLGLPSNEPEMKYIGPKSHLEENKTHNVNNGNGNISSRINGTPVNLNNLRDRHSAVVGKYGDINNIDRFKSMPFEQKESLMYYNEIVSGKADDNLDNRYLNAGKSKSQTKRDANKGHGLHSVKKKRREGRKELISLTPKERESISFLDGILQEHEGRNTDDSASQASSLGSVIDLVGDFESLSPSPNRKGNEKAFTMPQVMVKSEDTQVKYSKTTEDITTRTKSPSKEKREQKSKHRKDKKRHEATSEIHQPKVENTETDDANKKSKHKKKREKHQDESQELKIQSNEVLQRTPKGKIWDVDLDVVKRMNDLNISDEINDKLHNLKHTDNKINQSQTKVIIPSDHRSHGIENKNIPKSKRKEKRKSREKREETKEERRARRALRAENKLNGKSSAQNPNLDDNGNLKKESSSNTKKIDPEKQKRRRERREKKENNGIEKSRPNNNIIENVN